MKQLQIIGLFLAVVSFSEAETFRLQQNDPYNNAIINNGLMLNTPGSFQFGMGEREATDQYSFVNCYCATMSNAGQRVPGCENIDRALTNVTAGGSPAQMQQQIRSIQPQVPHVAPFRRVGA